MPEPTALKCPCCDAPLSVPEGRGQFFCQFCGTPVTVPARSAGDRAGPKRGVAIPEKLQVQELGGELRISWRWFSPVVLFLIPFCLAWNAFLVGWYTLALGGLSEMGGFAIIMILFPIAHVAVGIGLIYVCLVLLLNHTTVRVAQGEMSIRHGPIPAPGNRRIAADDVEQLYVRHERETRSKGGESHVYPLLARLRSGKEIKLLPRNSEVEVARAVEQLVETHLRIEDAPVAGEHRD